MKQVVEPDIINDVFEANLMPEVNVAKSSSETEDTEYETTDSGTDGKSEATFLN